MCVRYFFHISFYTLIIAFRFLYRSHFVLPIIWSTPYSADNKFFTGFAHGSLSGVGCPELGGLLLMPTTGELNVDYKAYGSEYKDEVAHPGYYSNTLTKYNIKAEATASMRTGLSRFTFPKGESLSLRNKR